MKQVIGFSLVGYWLAALIFDPVAVNPQMTDWTRPLSYFAIVGMTALAMVVALLGWAWVAARALKSDMASKGDEK